MLFGTPSQREPFQKTYYDIYSQNPKRQEPFRNIEKGDREKQTWQATEENRHGPNPRAAHRNTACTHNVIKHYLLKVEHCRSIAGRTHKFLAFMKHDKAAAFVFGGSHGVAPGHSRSIVTDCFDCRRRGLHRHVFCCTLLLPSLEVFFVDCLVVVLCSCARRTFKISLMKLTTKLFPSPDLPNWSFQVTDGISSSSVYLATTCGISKEASEWSAMYTAPGGLDNALPRDTQKSQTCGEFVASTSAGKGIARAAS